MLFNVSVFLIKLNLSVFCNFELLHRRRTDLQFLFSAKLQDDGSLVQMEEDEDQEESIDEDEDDT